MEEAYSREVWSAGWWPQSVRPGPAFYAYAYPEPDGFRGAAVRPTGALYDPGWGEFLLPYDAARTAADPAGVVLEFLQSTYEAAGGGREWQHTGGQPFAWETRPRSVGSSSPDTVAQWEHLVDSGQSGDRSRHVFSWRREGQRAR